MKRSSNQQTLLGFFPKKEKIKLRNEELKKASEPDPKPGPSTSTCESETEPNVGVFVEYEYDIGKFVSHPPKDDEEKLKALKEPWKPPKTFKFPVSIIRNKKLSFQLHWTEKYSWLVYSNIAQGAFCKMCVLFGRGEGGRGYQELGALVNKAYNNWRKALESFEHHENTQYHKFATEQAKNFTVIMKGKSIDVSESLRAADQKIAIENRQRLAAIVDTIMLCGRQELPLRGNEDSGDIGLEEPTHNDGNFRALLRFRARSGDEVLKNHLMTNNIHSRSLYTSPVIQNEIIELCGMDIQAQVIKRVNESESGFFTVLADETQDISRREQLSLCLRYVDCSNEKAVVREDFLEFVHVKDLTAQALATTIITRLLAFNLDMNKLVGQGYDGAAVMSGHLKGVRTIIANQYPRAQFVHCVAHVLNLVLAHSCELPMIRNCIGTIKNIISFFRQSPLRDSILKKTAEELETSHSTLIALCETRWTEKHMAVERFAEMYPTVLATLEELQNTAGSSANDVRTQAYQLQVAMDNGQFIIALIILKKVFSYTANLNKALQKVNVDLTKSMKHANTVKETLKNIRNDAEFSKLYEEAKKISTGDIMPPRITGRQTKRSNIPGETPEIYYRRNLFFPFIDHVISEIDARFKPHEETIAGIQLILPERTKNDSATKESLVKIARTFLGDDEAEKFTGEFELWHTHWSTSTSVEKPTTALEAIDECDNDFYPRVKKILQILATLPVSTATAERSFSTLKRLKTYIRNKMGDERLSGLALMSVHRELAVKTDPNDIVSKLISKRKRLNIKI